MVCLFFMKQKKAPATQSVKMATDAERLRFILRFLRMDLTPPLRRGDFYNLQEDLEAFFLPTRTDVKPGGLHTMLTEEPLRYSEADFRALQAEAYDVFAGVITSRSNPDTLVQ